MSKKYPRVSTKEKHGRGKCVICGHIPAGRVVVEIDIFRGDDEVYKVCASCQAGHSNRELLDLLGYFLDE